MKHLACSASGKSEPVSRPATVTTASSDGTRSLDKAHDPVPLMVGYLTLIKIKRLRMYKLLRMFPALGMHRRKRPGLFWLLALLLLWQQVALAASLCPMPGGQLMQAAVTPASQTDCMHGMRGMQDHATPSLCAQHYAQGSLVQSDTRLPNVPGSMLLPLAPSMPTVAMLPHAVSTFTPAFRLRADHPPLRLLFCSLLI